MGQYTCDECNEIPKIIQTNPKRSTILIRCKEHGLKELKLQSYILNSQNYNPNNWKCADSVTFQKDCKTNFKYCQCGSVFCDKCIGVHQNVQSHSNTIDSDKYYIRCKEGPDHFDKPFKGFCYECNTNYCSECEKIHKNHQKVLINSMYIKPDDIESIKKANKEYEKRIAYYQNLIKLNVSNCKLLDLSEFPFDRVNKDGHKGKCRKCTAEYNRKYNKQQKEKYLKIKGIKIEIGRASCRERV